MEQGTAARGDDSGNGVPEEDREIGRRVRAIRTRRGLSIAVVADFAKISKGQLSKLENGQKAWIKRGLIEDVAEALGCSPIDLTGMPSVAPDRRVVVAASAIPGLTAALHDTTLDDVPDVPTRPLAELVELADRAVAAADQVRYEVVSGSVLGDLVTELHVLAAHGAGDERRQALAALVSACIVARSLAGTLGHGELAVAATRRGWDAARRIERDDLAGLMAMGRAISLNRIGARHRAKVVLGEALAHAEQVPGPSKDDTSSAEARGMLHLAAAHLSARDGRLGDVDTHLGEADALARYTGERNFMRYHFGPANVGAWRLAVAVESDRGPEVAEQLAPVIDLGVLGSADRVASVHFDLARGFAQAGGSRDGEAMRYLDRADRLAPVRVRQDPIAAELAADLRRRARKRVWVLDSLCNRLGVA
jgi:transcriptional regulator with XRE-family HTH domain